MREAPGRAAFLATGIYQERAFDRLPILADALQDAGCDNDDVLTHCRQPGEHVRGCRSSLGQVLAVALRKGLKAASAGSLPMLCKNVQEFGDYLAGFLEAAFCREMLDTEDARPLEPTGYRTGGCSVAPAANPLADSAPGKSATNTNNIRTRWSPGICGLFVFRPSNVIRRARTPRQIPEALGEVVRQVPRCRRHGATRPTVPQQGRGQIDARRPREEGRERETRHS